MKLLITSDNHLGFKETDPIRSEDSFNTFTEIMKVAKQENVDLILQSGDLFDENRPSRNTYNKTLKILKEYCLGDTKPDFTALPPLNCQSPKHEVSLPILSIHGNHDDPSGFNSVSPLDVLHSSGLINYFGKVESVDEIEVNPILITGDKKIAIFGIGHIKDRRIQKTFTTKKVVYNRPVGDDWFNILMVHQNRTPREDGYLSEDLIDPFFDLVVYGHEHESIKINHKNFNVIQCGSTVRTSLCEGESMNKYVYVLDLNDKVFIRRIRLATIRPLVIENIKVQNTNPEQQINNKIEELLTEVKREYRNGNEMLPLLRLRVDLSGVVDFNRHKIQEMINGKIANPNDAIRITRRVEKEVKAKASIVKTFEIKDIFKQIIDGFDLKALIQPRVMDSLNDFIEKDIKESFNNLVNESVKNIIKHINFEDLVADSLDDAIKTAVNCIKKEIRDVDCSSESEGFSLSNEIKEDNEIDNMIENEERSYCKRNDSSILISKEDFKSDENEIIIKINKNSENLQNSTKEQVVELVKPFNAEMNSNKISSESLTDLSGLTSKIVKSSETDESLNELSFKLSKSTIQKISESDLKKFKKNDENDFVEESDDDLLNF